MIYGGAAVLAVAALVIGVMLYRSRVEGAAAALLADAVAITEAPVAPPPLAPGESPTPANPGGPPPPGSYPNEQAKLEAALAKFQAAADGYPRATAGIAARYQAAAILAQLGRTEEAVRAYQDVVTQAGATIYAKTAELGLADVQARMGQYDAAIAIYRKLAAQTDSDLPADAVLMQLARVLARQGNTAEAEKTFSRVLEEFPQSAFAADARKERDAVRPKA
jgi:TolA-binding protein